MAKKIARLMLAMLFTLSLVGSALADMIEGTVKSVAGEGRQVVVVKGDGTEVELRISGSSTTLEGVGSRSEIQPGMKVKGDYNPEDRNTAGSLTVTQ